MLDDHAGRLDEALDAFQRGIGVGHVVERQLLALQLGGGGDTDFGRFGFNVERRALMRVLAVAHFLGLDELGVEGAWELAAAFGAQGVGRLVDAAQVVGDHAVVGGGVLERLEHQVEALCVGQAACLEAFQYLTVIAGVDHDGDIFMVLCSGTDHGRAADIDVFDGGRQVAARLGNSGFKWVQINGDQIDRLDAVFVHDGVVDATTAQNATVDLGVQGLYPAVHHFCEAGVIGHFDCRNAVVLEQLERTASGKDLDAQRFELAGKFKDSGLVGYADQGAADRQAGSLVGHLDFHQKQKRSAKKSDRGAKGRLFCFECFKADRTV